MENIEELSSPPIVGQLYLVPCMFAKASTDPESTWWPILRPSHNNNKYFKGVVYKRDDPEAIFHYHTDPRFSVFPRHNFIDDAGQVVEFQAMQCLREMPPQDRIYFGFNKKFYKDYKNTRMRCFRCPHRGINLESMPVRNGLIECPAHGLQFDSESHRTIIEEYL